jgi:aspartyl-tRNA(Asn)/glutamyl-tRNA(Gln) amidotransferase subunit A
VALWLDAVTGYDPYDPDSLPHPGYAFADDLDAVTRRLRVAYLPSLGYGHVAPDVRRVVEAAVRAFAAALGVEVEFPAVHLTDVGMAWAFINAFQTNGRIAPWIDRHRDEFGRGFLNGVELGGRLGAPDIARCQQERYQLNCEVAELFSRYDLLVTPTCPTTAFAAGGPMPEVIDGQRLASPIHAVAFTYPFNMTGHPAISVPAGLGDDGLPIGMQIVAERGEDRLLLRAAWAFEQARPYPRWPAMPVGAP